VLLALALVASACEDKRPDDYYAAPPLSAASDSRSAPAPDPGVAPGPSSEGPDVAPPPQAADAAGAPPSRDALAPPPDRDATPPAPDARAAPESVTGRGPDVLLPNFARLFKRLSPSVVNIFTADKVRRGMGSPWSPGPDAGGLSLGTGLIFDEEGHILTNAHVVENAAAIRVRFHDDDELPAWIVGIDPVRDLALLRVDGKTDLTPVVAGDSDTVEVGDWVLAIGNPFGLSHTLTKGIVSAKGRMEFVSDTMGYVDLIQTDAAINSGNSGGPLFSTRGEVIGLATAVNAEGNGISFAIPFNQVRAALPRLRQGGQVRRSVLGVYLRPVDPQLQLDDALPRGGGVVVVGVVDGSPAARAGLEASDVIIGFNGRPVSGLTEFRLEVASSVAGTPIPMRLVRGAERVEVMVTLREAR